jgi:hypothetical protein
MDPENGTLCEETHFLKKRKVDSCLKRKKRLHEQATKINFGHSLGFLFSSFLLFPLKIGGRFLVSFLAGLLSINVFQLMSGLASRFKANFLP